MKKSLISIFLAIVLVLPLNIVMAMPVSANTIESSTIIFEGELTDNGDGTFYGVVYAIEEGGFDIYAEEGSAAWFGNDPGTGPEWTEEPIGSDHDAWSGWDPDTPDWYQYSLMLYYDGDLEVQKWALRNHPGSTPESPHSTDPAGMPMSGVMDWSRMYAAELDFGHYLPDTGDPEIPDGAAWHGGGLWHWDMDWSWGSESVPLQYIGFSVEIESLGESEYRVTLTPAPLPASEVWVDDDWLGYPYGTEVEDGKFYGYNAFATIQEGIKAVSHSTVYVYEGTYDESIVINGVDVDLIAVDDVAGDEDGDVIISPSTPAGGHGDIIQIYNCTATVDGFTIDGGLLSMGGIYARGMASLGENEVDVTIKNNHVSGFEKNGITINGELAEGLVKDNIVIGSGPVGPGYWAQNGIQFGYGATGQVHQNQVELAWYTGGDWTACGILIFEASDVSVKQNEVNECQTGIGIETWGWYVPEASFNKVANNIVNDSKWGITVSAYSWGYSNMDSFANNNKIINNVITTTEGEIGIYVGAYNDLSGPYIPEADNNKIIHNTISGFDEQIVDEGTATKSRSNIIPIA